MRNVLISGVTGQDGWYLAELLTSQGHCVTALVRGQRPVKLPWGVEEVRGDLTDQGSLISALRAVQPDVVCNLAAVSSIGISWSQPESMSNVTGLGVLRLLEAIRVTNPLTRLVQASSADQFGNFSGTATENTPFNPRTPYGVAKLYAHALCQSYREAYGMHISTAIMYSHTSDRQSKEFVVPKVTQAAALISRGQQDELALGNLNIRRDWGWAPDFVRAFPLMAAKPTPDDYILSTNTSHSLQDLCTYAFEAVGLDWQRYVKTDVKFIRPTDVTEQVGSHQKARDVLNWWPTRPFREMVTEMVKESLQ